MSDVSTTRVAAAAVGVSKIYGSGTSATTALDAIDLEISLGSLTAIMGPSGSGKSTLMHVFAGLDTASSGQLSIGDTDITHLDDTALTLLRRRSLGFVFQAFNLVPTLTVLGNVTLPFELDGRKPTTDEQTVVLVTHDPVAASHADRVIFIADGRVVQDVDASDAKTLSDIILSLEVAA